MRKTLINALCLFIAVLSGICLFILKYQVKEEERLLQKIHREILQNKREIHMLEAEWAHLNDPQRLLELVQSQTNWERISAKQISMLSDIPLRPELLPKAPEVIEIAEETQKAEPEKQSVKKLLPLRHLKKIPSKNKKKAKQFILIKKIIYPKPFRKRPLNRKARLSAVFGNRQRGNRQAILLSPPVQKNRQYNKNRVRVIHSKKALLLYQRFLNTRRNADVVS